MKSLLDIYSYNDIIGWNSFREERKIIYDRYGSKSTIKGFFC